LETKQLRSNRPLRHPAFSTGSPRLFHWVTQGFACVTQASHLCSVSRGSQRSWLVAICQLLFSKISATTTHGSADRKSIQGTTFCSPRQTRLGLGRVECHRPLALTPAWCDKHQKQVVMLSKATSEVAKRPSKCAVEIQGSGNRPRHFVFSMISLRRPVSFGGLCLRNRFYLRKMR
jgi:hypothetical protein